MFSLSDSNPCRGADPRRRADSAGRLDVLLGGFPVAALAVADLRGPPSAAPAPIRERPSERAGVLLGVVAPAAASRAAVRRGLERWGRVWGRLTRTSRSPRGVVDRELPLASLIQSTSAEGRGGRGSASRLNLDWRGVSMGV